MITDEMKLPECVTYSDAEKLCYCKKRTLQRAVAAGKIVTFRRGRKTMLELKSLTAWLHGSKREVVKIGRPRQQLTFRA